MSFYTILDDELNIFPFCTVDDMAYNMATLEQYNAKVTGRTVRPLYIGEECQVLATQENIQAALNSGTKCIEIHSNNNANNGWLYRIEKLQFLTKITF